MRLPLAALLCIGLLAALPAAAQACSRGAFDPADQPPFGGEIARLSGPLPPSLRPPGFELTAGRATAIATGALTPGGTVRRFETRTRSGPGSVRQWQVDYFDPEGKDVGQVVIQDAAACVVEKWTGEQVETKLARGYPGAVSGKVSSLWLWLPLCVLFLAPFIDPRQAAPADPPRPAGAARLQRLARLLQPREDRGLGRARLPGARLSLRADADRRLSAD